MKKELGDIILHFCTTNSHHVMFGSQYMKCDRIFLSFCTIFSPFTPLATQKIETLKNWKKDLEISSFYICAPQMTITWCMVHQIWSTIDRILDNFLPYPTNNPEIEIFKKPKKQKKKKKKKTWRYHHFTLRCTKSHNPMLYCSWDMTCDICNYFLFWAIFCFFTTLTVQKVKILKKWKKCLEISSFYTSEPKILITCYTNNW